MLRMTSLPQDDAETEALRGAQSGWHDAARVLRVGRTQCVTRESVMTLKRHEPAKILSKAVEANGFVFTAGLTAEDRNLDVVGQTKQVLAEIDRVLKLAGTDKSKVMQATIWVPDIRLRDGMNEAWNAWTGGQNLPARACIEAKLADPKLLVEISVVAVK